MKPRMFETWYRLLPLFAVTLLASCAVVEIQSPDAGCSASAQPIQYRVKFSDQFKPGTFSAVLTHYNFNLVTSEVTITQDFTPPPAPGGISVANGASFTGTQSRLSVVGESDQLFSAPTNEVTFEAPSLQLVPPGSSFNYVNSRCVVGRSPRLAPDLNVNDVISIEVGIPRVLTNNQSNLTISLTSNTNNIAFQGQLPGAPSTVTWAANANTRTSFNIRAVQSGSFQIFATAPGYKATLLSGQVKP